MKPPDSDDDKGSKRVRPDQKLGVERRRAYLIDAMFFTSLPFTSFNVAHANVVGVEDLPPTTHENG